MLLLDGAFEIGGLSLFRDHIAPNTFHYLPDSPSLVRPPDGAGVQLIRYRGDRGGGFLTLDVQLETPPAALAEARKRLSAGIGQEANLVPVLFGTGSVRLALLDLTPEAPPPAGIPGPPRVFVEHVIGTARPSLLGRQRAVFSVELSPEGAVLAEVALRGQHTPAVVCYELEFAGLELARGVRASVDYRMAYDYFRARFTANTLCFKTDIDRETEALLRQGAIRVEDVDYTGNDPEIRARRQAEIREMLLEWARGSFFRPASSPASLGARALGANPETAEAWSRLGYAQAAFSLRELRQSEEQTLTYDRTQTCVAKRTVAPQGALDLPSGIDPAKIFLDVDLTWPPAALEIRAFTDPEPDWEGVAGIEADLRQGEEVRTLALQPGVTGKSAQVSATGAVEVKVRALAIDEPEALVVAAPPEPTFQPLTTQNLYLDPQALVQRWRVRVALGAVDCALVQRAYVTLSANGAERQIALEPQKPEQTVVVRGCQPLACRAELITAAGAIVVVENSIQPFQPVALINLPADRFQALEVMLLDPLDRFEAVAVELEQAPGTPRAVVRLDNGSPTARWSAPRAPDAAGRTFRYRVSKIGRDGRAVQEDWREESGGLLVVGDLETRVETLRGLVIGGERSLGGVLRLESLAPPPEGSAVAEIVLEPAQLDFQVRLPFQAQAERRYRVEGQLFLEDSVLEIAPREETAEVLILRADQVK